jgi:hypothetical protein
MLGQFELYVKCKHGGTDTYFYGNSPHKLPNGTGLSDKHTFDIAWGDDQTTQCVFSIKRVDAQPGGNNPAFVRMSHYPYGNNTVYATGEYNLTETAEADAPDWVNMNSTPGWSYIFGPLGWWDP